MKIYLDNCCYNRPYDDQSQIRISLEAQAKLHIQSEIKNGKYELVSSYILDYEVNRNPHTNTKEGITDFLENNASIYVSDDKKDEIEEKAEKIQSTGVKNMDSLHVSCAIMADADYFLTTDDRLLKYQSENIKIVSPVDFVSEMEDE